MSSTHQLAAILFTDIAGYTAMMQEDETAALAVVRHYTTVLKEVVSQYQGSIVNDYGDGNLCTFTSATEALRCAIDLQRKLQSEPKVPLRVGLHVGEIFFEDGKVFGDGVNVASRIQSLGVANSVLFSGEIYSKISNQTEFKPVSLGNFHFKNVAESMEVFALAGGDLIVPKKGSMKGKLKVSVTPIKKWIAVAAVILVALVLIFLYKQYSKRSIPGDIEKSIAVLAFVDMSPSKDQEHISDGISEEIINSLVNLKGLKVIARTSSFYFKGKDVPLAEIADKLGVEHILEGSVRKVDDQLRITVQLVTKDGFHLFSETFSRPATDLLNMQSEIAEIIARKLLKDLTPQQQLQIKADKASSVEAYEYYLRGQRLGAAGSAVLTLSEISLAEDLYWKAISLDPDFAPTYGRLADLYDTRGNNPLYRSKAWKLRDSLGRVGYRLNPTSPEVLTARVLTFFKSDFPDPDSTLYFLKAAFALHPSNALVNRFIGGFYVRIGMDAQAREFLNKSIEMDPLNRNPWRGLARAKTMVGDLTGAEMDFKKVIELDFPLAGDHLLLAGIYVMKGELENAANELAIAEKLGGDRNSVQRAMLLAAEGEKEAALRISRDINVLCLLRMKDEALEALESTESSPVIEPVSHIASLEKNPIFDFVREEPEFKRIYARKKKEYDENVKRYGSLD